MIRSGADGRLYFHSTGEPLMADINASGLVKAARNIQKPVSLATVALLVLYLIFSQIIGKVTQVDQTILNPIVNWIGIITLVAVVMSIISYALPLFLKGRAGELVVGTPRVTKPGVSARSSGAQGSGSES
jgi:hypothetical protein